jgi:predicted nucleic acid-binding protein
MKYVLDASVAAKWLLPPDAEQLSDRATEWLQALRARDLLFVVPDLFWSEIGNILWKAARSNRLSSDAAAAAFTSTRDLGIRTIPSMNMLSSAFKIAVAFQRSFYDSVYLALAESTGHPLLTADERLANAVAAYLPVRWLGAI